MRLPLEGSRLQTLEAPRSRYEIENVDDKYEDIKATKPRPARTLFLNQYFSFFSVFIFIFPKVDSAEG